MSKTQALHNEEACNYLHSSNKFNDWVITTAFYSALHFVQYEIFPLNINKTTFEDLNQYYNNTIKSKPLSKHTTTIHLVNSKIPKASPYYRWLHDACMNARYMNFNVSYSKANKAKQYLSLIKNEISKLSI